MNKRLMRVQCRVVQAHNMTSRKSGSFLSSDIPRSIGNAYSSRVTSFPEITLVGCSASNFAGSANYPQRPGTRPFPGVQTNCCYVIALSYPYDNMNDP
jgi:hypothetical protein